MCRGDLRKSFNKNVTYWVHKSGKWINKLRFCAKLIFISKTSANKEFYFLILIFNLLVKETIQNLLLKCLRQKEVVKNRDFCGYSLNNLTWRQCRSSSFLFLILKNPRKFSGQFRSPHNVFSIHYSLLKANLKQQIHLQLIFSIFPMTNVGMWTSLSF